MIEKNGFILLHKPNDITSFQALNEIKRKLNLRRVGHTGTLDKFADGLLIVLAGKCTRFTPFLSHLDKEYIAGIRFGVSTDTLDPEGKVIEEADVPSEQAIISILGQFIGEIDQIPPAFSAIHQNGERVYKKALRGEEIRLVPRKVHIYQLKPIIYQAPFLTISVHCSGGTYIRALARDLGKAAGSCAYVTALTRTKIGDFRLLDAVTPSAFDPEKHMITPKEFLGSWKGINIAFINSSLRNRIFNGSLIDDTCFPVQPEHDGVYALFDDAALVALVEKKEKKYRYIAVFREE